MSGSRAFFIGDGMAAVVEGIHAVREAVGHPSVVVGGLAVLSRLSTPYRATVDLDIVDRSPGAVPQLEVLRATDSARDVQPAAVVLPTRFGEVKVDVLEVRQAELDYPSDDPGDRLHASSHAWAHDTATDVTIRVVTSSGQEVEATTPVAEPGPLIAMKLQAIMNRSVDKQGTDLLDIVRIVLDSACRPAALAQLAAVDGRVAADVALHVDLWRRRRRNDGLRWMQVVGGDDISTDDIDLVAEVLTEATRR